MGLHRTPSYGIEYFSVSQQEDRRTCWTAYILQTIALEDGRISSTHDWGFDLPIDGAVLHCLSTWKSFVDLAPNQLEGSPGAIQT